MTRILRNHLVSVVVSMTIMTALNARSVAQMFLGPDIYPSGGSGPKSVVVADLNGDGTPDIAVANNDSNNVAVLMGAGDGSFEPAVIYDSGGPPMSVAAGDVNGDGKPDLVLQDGDYNGPATIVVLLNNGDGTFQSGVIYDAGGHGHYPGNNALAFADVNGDGKIDLLEANDDDNYWSMVSVLLGNGDGTFRPAVNSPSCARTARALAVGDLNADGKPDVVLAAVSAMCSFLGNGDGTFQLSESYKSQDMWTSMVYADVDGDGLPDLILADQERIGTLIGGVGIMLANGDGTFGELSFYEGITTLDVAVGDVNDDSIVDLVASGYDLGKREGATTVLGQTYYWGSNTRAREALADLNGDGKLDLVVLVDPGDTLYVLMNNTGYHSPTSTTLTSSEYPALRGNQVIYTAKITSESGGIVTRTVTFQDKLKKTQVKVHDNQATYSTIYNHVGVRTISATYSGDSNNYGSSASMTEYVGPAGTKTLLATAGSPVMVGQAVTFTATITPVNPAFGMVPDGELVAFYDGTTLLGSVGLVGGTAAYTTSSLSAKTHSIKARYAGDTLFKTSGGSVSQVVLRYSTTTALISSPNPSNYGQLVTFTAMVKGSGPHALTGNVRFLDGGFAIGHATLDGGVATLNYSKLLVGKHPITAMYSGDAHHDNSTSPVRNQVVR